MTKKVNELKSWAKPCEMHSQVQIKKEDLYVSLNEKWLELRPLVTNTDNHGAKETHMLW